MRRKILITICAFAILFLGGLNYWQARAEGTESGLIPDSTNTGYISELVRYTDIREAAVAITNYFLQFLGLVGLLMIVYAGVKMVTSGGNEDAKRSGQKILLYVGVGLIVIFLAYAFIVWIIGSTVDVSELDKGTSAPKQWCYDESGSVIECTDVDLNKNATPPAGYNTEKDVNLNKNATPPRGYNTETDVDLGKEANPPAGYNTEASANNFENTSPVQDLPILPGLPALPNVAGVPTFPGLPGLPSVPGLPGLPALPNVAGIWERITSAGTQSPATTKLTEETKQSSEQANQPLGISKETDIYQQISADSESSLGQLGELFLKDRQKKINLSERSAAKNLATLKEQTNKLMSLMPASSLVTQDFKEALAKFEQEPSVENFMQLQNVMDELVKAAKGMPKMSAKIKVLPAGGNAPLVAVFDGSDSRDPSGESIPAQNYHWWYTDVKGQKIELARAAYIVETFTEPNTYMMRLLVTSVNKEKGEGVMDGEAAIAVTVAPPLSDLKLKINEKDIGSVDHYQITLSDAQAGLVFDPTDSKPAAGFEFIRTEWDFGDHSFRKVIEGSLAPITHIYPREGDYTVIFAAIDNANHRDRRIVNLKISTIIPRISVTPEVGTTDTTFKLSAVESRFDYASAKRKWEIYNSTGELIYEDEREFFEKQFESPGSYSVKLILTDTENKEAQLKKVLEVKSQKPKAVLKLRLVPGGAPSEYILDASESFDLDKGDALNYKWFVDNEETKLELMQPSRGKQIEPKGKYIFKTKGEYTVKLEVTDLFGETAVEEEKVTIPTIFQAELKQDPLVAHLEEEVKFVIEGEKANFYFWEFGDDVKEQTDNASIAHIYHVAGVFDLKITIYFTEEGEEEEFHLTRKVYVGMAGEPFPRFQFELDGEIKEPVSGLCGEQAGIEVYRRQQINFDASLSVNRDGTNRLLDYSWNFGDGILSDKRQTSHRFADLSPENQCFSIVLTVKDRSSEKTASADPLYFKVVNAPPTLKYLKVTADKDYAPLVVNLNAFEAKDPDGNITNYRWYYYAEDNPDEELGVQTTKTPLTTLLVSPRGGSGQKNVYYFLVELTDNDGIKVNNEELLGKTDPLVITNREIEYPSLEVSADKVAVHTGESIHFYATGETASGNPISDGYYNWDFDGNGVFDQKSAPASLPYLYEKAGSYHPQVKLEYEGLVVTKTLDIFVEEKDLLPKAAFTQSVFSNKLIFQNHSLGIDLKYAWDFDLSKDSDGDGDSANDVDSILPEPTAEYGTAGKIYQVKLTITDFKRRIDTVTHQFDFTTPRQLPADLLPDPTKKLQALLFTVPQIQKDGKVHITQRQNTITFYAGESLGKIKEYRLDFDVNQDSDGNGYTDDDIDNKETLSYRNGSSIKAAYAPTTNPIIVRLEVIDVDGNRDVMKRGIVFDEIEDVSVLNPLPEEGVSDLDFIIIKLRFYLKTLTPQERLQINQALSEIRSLYGKDSKQVALKLGEIKAITEKSNLVPEGKTRVVFLLQQIGEITDKGPGTIPDIIEKIKQQEQVGLVSSEVNLNLNTSIENQSTEKELENQNVNQAPKEGQVTVSESQKEALWLKIFKWVFSYLKWFLLVVAILIIVFLGGFVVYKKVTGEADLDFEEFVLELRGRIEEKLRSLSAKKEIEESAKTIPGQPEAKPVWLKPEENIFRKPVEKIVAIDQPMIKTEVIQKPEEKIKTAVTPILEKEKSVVSSVNVNQKPVPVEEKIAVGRGPVVNSPVLEQKKMTTKSNEKKIPEKKNLIENKQKIFPRGVENKPEVKIPKTETASIKKEPVVSPQPLEKNTKDVAQTQNRLVPQEKSDTLKSTQVKLESPVIKPKPEESSKETTQTPQPPLSGGQSQDISLSGGQKIQTPNTKS